MKKIDVRALISSKNKKFFEKYPRFFTNIIIKLLEKLLHAHDINNFLSTNAHVKGIDFIDEIFEVLDFSYSISARDIQKVPSEDKLICVANHPLGALDGLAVLKAISTVRRDVKIIANDVLLNIENLADQLLPYNVFSTRMQKEHIHNIAKSIQQEQAIIFFPAAEVSRMGLKGIRDPRWLNGATFFAKKYKVPVLPIFVKAKNSMFFYLMSFINKRLSMFLLAHEIFNKRSKNITLKIGDPIPGKVFSSRFIDTKTSTRLLRKHVYRLAKNRRCIFKTEKTIIHPTDRRLIKNDLLNSAKLGETLDDKKIFLVDYENAGHVMREIGRLRELTFRRVGEGTGLKLDIDKFDRYYKHIVLWDDEELEIVGSYRVGICKDIIKKRGMEGLYTASLFSYHDGALPILQNALELGRSFVQEQYWKSNALDYLWQGIGAFITRAARVGYLVGPVSISNNYTEEAKLLLVYFYKKYFADDSGMAISKNQYIISHKHAEEMEKVFTGENYREDYRRLKEALKLLGFTVPILYRQYSELCKEGGVKFLDFGVDPDFANCVDGLILINLDLLKESKRERYITYNLENTEKKV